MHMSYFNQENDWDEEESYYSNNYILNVGVLCTADSFITVNLLVLFV